MDQIKIGIFYLEISFKTSISLQDRSCLLRRIQSPAPPAYKSSNCSESSRNGSWVSVEKNLLLQHRHVLSSQQHFCKYSNVWGFFKPRLLWQHPAISSRRAMKLCLAWQLGWAHSYRSRAWCFPDTSKIKPSIFSWQFGGEIPSQ